MANTVCANPNESNRKKTRPTRRAPDWWESARFLRLFLAWSFFRLPSRVSASPLAANANRWAVVFEDWLLNS
jgi:hypothetical protein